MTITEEIKVALREAKYVPADGNEYTRLNGFTLIHYPEKFTTDCGIDFHYPEQVSARYTKEDAYGVISFIPSRLIGWTQPGIVAWEEVIEDYRYNPPTV